jgi:hypothetical protein
MLQGRNPAPLCEVAYPLPLWMSDGALGMGQYYTDDTYNSHVDDRRYCRYD